MPDPTHPPTPCAVDALYLHGIRCVRDGETTKWEDVWVAGSELGGVTAPLLASSTPCGGCAKSKLLDLAREAKWSAEDTIKALKAIG